MVGNLSDENKKIHVKVLIINRGVFYYEYISFGILSKMMRIYEEYAKKNNYKEITIKTDNSKREMLNYLVKNNWNLVDVITKGDIKDYEIILKKEI